MLCGSHPVAAVQVDGMAAGRGGCLRSDRLGRVLTAFAVPGGGRPPRPPDRAHHGRAVASAPSCTNNVGPGIPYGAAFAGRSMCASAAARSPPPLSPPAPRGSRRRCSPHGPAPDPAVLPEMAAVPPRAASSSLRRAQSWMGNLVVALTGALVGIVVEEVLIALAPETDLVRMRCRTLPPRPAAPALSRPWHAERPGCPPSPAPHALHVACEVGRNQDADANAPPIVLVRVSGVSAAARVRAVGRSFVRDLATDVTWGEHSVHLLGAVRRLGRDRARDHGQAVP